ncbi:MAG TPA: hypothetical protein VKQ72_04720 [Aggregatilineales bacterium]|nr:hypothetical protein [Aggregatilineales bacterium]
MVNQVSQRSRQGFVLRPWMVVTVLCTLYLILITIHYYGSNSVMRVSLTAGEPSTFAFPLIRYQTPALEFVFPTPSGTEGYDGQFTYNIAADPLNAASTLDVPAYRYQRILQPLMARLLAFGQKLLIPWAMLGLDLVALAFGTAMLEQLLLIEHVSRWNALTYGLFGGLFFAVRVSTSEPLAYGLVLAGILAGQRKNFGIQAILFGLAAFAKETTILFTVGYLGYFLLQRRWRDCVRLTILGVLPFILWQIVLRLCLGQFGIGSGGAKATPFELIPFNGIWRIREAGMLVFVLFSLMLIPSAVFPSLWALWRGARDLIRQRWHPYVFVLLANAAIMPFVPFSTYREPLGIARFLDGLVISVVLYAALRKSRGVLRLTTLWIAFGLRLLG